MTSVPGFLKTLKTVAGKKLRGIRDSMPQGYILGRASSGNGPPELISMDSLLAGIKGIIGGIAANPTATASDVAVNGTATTFMRSDAAPAVQKTSSTAFGLAKVDGTTITAAGGVISAASAANPTATASDVAVNGTATTFMRSDAAPAVQKTSATQFGLAKVDGTSITAAGGVISTVNNGTVTSVGLTMPAEFAVTGSPVTTTGTLAVTKATQVANTFYAGPTSGLATVPTFRVMSVNDPVGWGFTAGSIPFMTATGIAEDNTNLFWNSTIKGLGIGKHPNSSLDVGGTVTSSGHSDLPANTGGTFRMAGGYPSPIVGKIFVGDGTGWQLTITQRNSGIDADLFYFLDTGLFGIGKVPSISLDVNGPIGAKVYTVATLPSATAKAGQFAFISDATLTAITGLGLAPTGGGTNFVPVYSDGAGWKII